MVSLQVLLRTSKIAVYDRSANSWGQATDSLTSVMGNVGVSLINNNTVIIIGGTNGSVDVKRSTLHSLSTVEIIIGYIIPKKQ